MSIIGEDNAETLVALLADEGNYHMTSDFLAGDNGVSPEHRQFLVSWMMTVLPLLAFLCFHMILLPSHFCLCKTALSSVVFVHKSGHGCINCYCPEASGLCV